MHVGVVVQIAPEQQRPRRVEVEQRGGPVTKVDIEQPPSLHPPRAPRHQPIELFEIGDLDDPPDPLQPMASVCGDQPAPTGA